MSKSPPNPQEKKPSLLFQRRRQTLSNELKEKASCPLLKGVKATTNTNNLKSPLIPVVSCELRIKASKATPNMFSPSMGDKASFVESCCFSDDSGDDGNHESPGNKTIKQTDT